MARRGFGGMTALRAALGAATGVGQGLQQREVLAEQRRKEAEEAMFRRIQAGLTPVEDVLPQEQGNIGPMATKPAAPPPMSPATLGQAIAQRTQVPAGGAELMAPPAFGTPAAMAPTPERPVSNFERVMSDFQGRAPRTVRIGDQRYAMQPTQQENMALNIALQQAAQQDTKAAEAAQIRRRVLAIASRLKVDEATAEALVGGVDQKLLGLEPPMSPLEIKKLEAEIRRINAETAKALRTEGAPKGPSQEDKLKSAGVWNSLTRVPDGQLTPEESQFRNTMVRTFDRLRADDKITSPLDLIFQAVEAARSQEAIRRQNRPKADGDGKVDADLEEARKRETGNKPSSVTATPSVTQKPSTTARRPAAPVQPPASLAVAEAADKEARRHDLWNQIKAQNPDMSDDAITAQVKKEIP